MVPERLTPWIALAAGVLVIGMGAGQLPMLMQRSGLFVDAVEIDDVKWQQILKAREYYEEHAVVPPIRKFAKYIGENQKDMFKVWMTGPMKPITKYGGLPKPTGCV